MPLPCAQAQRRGFIMSFSSCLDQREVILWLWWHGYTWLDRKPGWEGQAVSVECPYCPLLLSGLWRVGSALGLWYALLTQTCGQERDGGQLEKFASGYTCHQLSALYVTYQPNSA